MEMCIIIIHYRYNTHNQKLNTIFQKLLNKHTNNNNQTVNSKIAIMLDFVQTIFYA